MSFASMQQELLGIPGLNLGLVKTKINEAFSLIQDENVWSFQLQTGGWLTPGLLGGYTSSFLSPGTISVQPFTNVITGDAVASAAWAKANNPFITQYQIRVPYYSLYNIIGYTTVPYPSMFVLSDTVTGQLYSFSVTSGAWSFQPVGFGVPISNPIFFDAGLNLYWLLEMVNGSLTISVTTNIVGFITQYLVSDTATNLTRAFQVFDGSFQNVPSTAPLLAQLTLDRLWTEPAQVNSGYMAYQAYFPLPAGFRRMYAVRDTVNNQEMNWWSYTQVDLSQVDPQRTDFSQPEYVVYYGPDTRANSATYGQGLMELWQGPITQLPYTCQWQVNWPALVNPNDTVPFPLTEELVKFRAYEVLALFKESQKGDEMERGSGANWQFLAKYYHDEYTYCLKKIRVADRNICDLYFQKMNRNPGNSEPFASVTGQMSVGS